MKIKLIITNKNKDVIYSGNAYDLPVHDEMIKKKSIELFDDDEPCIIHQSYATQKLIDGFLKQFQGVDVHDMKFKDSKEDFSFIKLEHIGDLYLTIKR
jgi:hypothetical protein